MSTTIDTDVVPDTPKPPAKKDMSKVHEARRKKAAERRLQKAQQNMLPSAPPSPAKTKLDEAFSKQDKNAADDDSSSSSDEEQVLYYEPPADYKEKKAKKAAEKKQQRKMLTDVYAMMLNVQKELAEVKTTAKKVVASKPANTAAQFKEEINRTPSVHPVRALYNLS